MQVFLGYPPENVKNWIEEHQKPEKYMGPLCFTAEEDNSSVAIIAVYGGDQIDIFANLEVSTDGMQTWTPWDGSTVTLANSGDKVYVRATSEGNEDGMSRNYGGAYHKFNLSGKIAASGNIQYLLTQDGSRTDVPAYCYYYMFQNCTALTQSPELPATTLADSCYYYMFQNCTSLISAPELPATTLDEYCYSLMFNNCTSLAQAPELPATTLALNCYNSMFSACSSLTQAPELPATTLADRCYHYMFEDCPKFSTVKMKTEMNGVYNTSTHGNIQKTVEYVL